MSSTRTTFYFFKEKYNNILLHSENVFLNKKNLMEIIYQVEFIYKIVHKLHVYRLPRL